MNFKTSIGNRFILLYGSQTGQAQAIAEEICERAPDFNLHADLHCLGSVDKKFCLENESVAVFVVSTTGLGDPPDTALKFWKRIKKISLSDRHLCHLKYCLLGLGDSNYDKFANFGKNLDRRLQQLGAVKLADTGFGDDATGLDIVVEPWITNLWPALLNVLQCKSTDVSQTQNQLIITLSDISNSVIENSQIDKNTQSSEVMQIDEQEITLGKSTSALKDIDLNLPPLPKAFIKLKFDEVNFESGKYPANHREFPLAVSDLKYANLLSAKKLTNEEAKKSVLEICLEISNTELQFQPGDSFGIICENDDEEIQLLIDRLDLNTVADLSVNVEPINDDPIAKKKVKGQSHLPSVSSVRQILLTCCDIRAVPKKVHLQAFIRLLVEFTTDTQEKRRLQELCSRQGSAEYSSLIRDQSLSLLDLLMEFKSCKPSIERLLEHLPPLQARCYSVANYLNPDVIRCVFTLVEIEKMTGHYAERRGVCTSWLDKISRSIQVSRPNNEVITLEAQVSKLLLVDPLVDQKIAIFKRKSTGFHMPADHKVPIIMICAGAGIAPFIGFLECRHEQRQKGIASQNWLIFGCRNELKDFLYEKEIAHYRNSGTLVKFTLALSQSNTQKARYVQDGIKDEAEEFVYWVDDLKAIIYVCGDVKNMMKDVRSQIEECFMQQKGLTQEAATKFTQELLDKKLYLQDV
uniref:Methionine synthase reductase n=1 Tax=Strigamia maritima TaxID=126957 RepID=T1JG33_STRMM